MSDHRAADTDPVDTAYVQAEALLTDEAARAARRARLLGEVDRDTLARVSPLPPSPELRPAQRRAVSPAGGWLAAACVAGFSLFLVTRTYQPPRPALIGPTPVRPAAMATAPSQAAPAVSESARQPAPALLTGASGPPSAKVAEPNSAGRAEAAADAQSTVKGSALSDAPVRAERFAGAFAAPPTGALAPDPGARLRAAAAAGRADDVKHLLDAGTQVDSPDAEGNTALMQSTQADHPTVSIILRRHGADPDRKNQAGKSARDMARTISDPAMARAIGAEP